MSEKSRHELEREIAELREALQEIDARVSAWPPLANSPDEKTVLLTWVGARAVHALYGTEEAKRILRERMAALGGEQ